jgi:hypothetical protein
VAAEPVEEGVDLLRLRSPAPVGERVGEDREPALAVRVVMGRAGEDERRARDRQPVVLPDEEAETVIEGRG